jgi:hypothetical protein
MVKKPTHASSDDDNNYEDDENGGKARMRIDPLIKALLGHLPASKSVWPPQERSKWIALLSEALGVIYRDAEPPKGQPGAATPQHPTGTVPTAR